MSALKPATVAARKERSDRLRERLDRAFSCQSCGHMPTYRAVASDIGLPPTIVFEFLNGKSIGPRNAERVEAALGEYE